MPVRLVALDEGPDILLDRAMVVVGRHPSCDTRLDSLRVSRQHCCMSQDKGEVTVRDLGSTNGIRINGQRVERGRLRHGDELSIAHIRFRLENGHGHEQTIVESDGPASALARAEAGDGKLAPPSPVEVIASGAASPFGTGGENALAAAVRNLLPNGVADKCRIQVIVQMAGDEKGQPEDDPEALVASHAAENAGECHSASSHS